MSKRKATDNYESVNDPDIRANGDPKPVENKADKFRRLANKRVPAAVKRLLQVANLGNRAQYESTPEQRSKILKALNDANERVFQSFANEKPAVSGWSL
jgi:hypothetical protein